MRVLFDNFHILAEAPGGMARLRELVLQLAVMGKLVPQDPADEPAAVLLEKIKKEKQRLIKEGKIKKQKPLPEITDAEKPYELPKGWEWSCLSEIGMINPRNTAQDELEASFVPMPFISAEYGADVKTETRLWGEIKKGYTHFKENDVSLAKITPCFENGKSSVMRGLTNGIGAGTTELHIFRLLSQISPAYILIYLKSPKFINNGISKMTGSAGQKRVPKKYFEANPFPLPPFNEQKRIVETVNRLMALCDQLEKKKEKRDRIRTALNKVSLHKLLASREAGEFNTHWRRISENFDLLYGTPANVAQLRQAVLQLAVMGKLTRRWRAENSDASIRKKTFLKEVVTKLKIGPFGTMLHKADYIYGGIPIVNPKHFREQRILVDQNLTVSLDKYKELSGYILSENDIIMGRRGEMGRCAVITKMEHGWLCGTGSLFMTPAKCVYPIYLLFCLISQGVKNYLINSSVGTTMNNLNLRIVENIEIPLPPFEEQKEIVRQVEQLMALCDSLEKKLADGQKKQDTLFKAVVNHLHG
ncbi:MAG: restriction endonuclease subunit S [bacterium]|nr:restriction endonuclease subunit S [bacterium]